MANSSHSNECPDIAVIGAGIIGVTCALQLARQGLRVTLIDQQLPGHGASFGNAGHLATEQVFPIADLSILKRLPAMLLDPMGPLRLDWRYLPKALPWFVRLLLNLRPQPFQRSIEGLRRLNENSLPAWQRLLLSIQRPDLLRKEGSLLIFEQAASHPAVEALQARMHEQDVAVEFWNADTVQQAAPQLSNQIAGGLFFPETGQFIDPYQTVCELADAAREAGVEYVQQRIVNAQISNDAVILFGEQSTLKAHKVLIACGAHAAPLTHALTGKRVPLETERGYHLMLPNEHERLPFPVTSFERKFIMTPMSGGLRLAGTVEFAGLQQAPNMARAWQLQRLSKGLFKQELNSSDASPWMGFRPSLPDSLPVIDSACDGRVLLAFGHQHLGLTQAAYTAELVAQLNAPDSPAKQQALATLAPYRLQRF